MEGYSISQTAQRFGVEPHTLRFYEKEGIIHPGRTKNGIRVYSQENVAQLEMAMCLKSTGMPIAGKRAVVLGRSNIVGKPMAMLLLLGGAAAHLHRPPPAGAPRD